MCATTVLEVGVCMRATSGGKWGCATIRGI